MLQPFDWAVLTVDEAVVLMNYIQYSTATKTMPINYDKMGRLGILEMYEKLRCFVEVSRHYKTHLSNIDSSDLVSYSDLPT